MESLGVCDLCAKPEQTLRCSRCKSAFYCSAEHQRLHWRRHKRQCKTLAEAKQLAAANGEQSVSIGVSAATNSSPASPQQGLTPQEAVRMHMSNDEKQLNEDNLVECSNVTNDSQSASATDIGDIFNKHHSNISRVVRHSTGAKTFVHVGSSEREIMNCKTQALSPSVDIDEYLKIRDTNVPHATVKMPLDLDNSGKVIANGQTASLVREPRFKEYPETSLLHTSSALPFRTCREIDKLSGSVLKDLETYGVCVIDNFLGSTRGNLVLNEVLQLYSSGVFTDGELVSNVSNGGSKNIRGDKITWIDGSENNVVNIKQLVHEIDAVVQRAHKMSQNGPLSKYTLGGRTKAMVACYPGSGSHYVKHVDNPNRDGRCVTVIYYLNKNWDHKQYGGLLRIFPEGSDNVADIEPIFDRLLFFWSDRRNPHEVQPALHTRYAITIWYFDKLERDQAYNRFQLAKSIKNKNATS